MELRSGWYERASEAPANPRFRPGDYRPRQYRKTSWPTRKGKSGEPQIPHETGRRLNVPASFPWLAGDYPITIRKGGEETDRRAVADSRQERSRNRQADGDGDGDDQRAILPLIPAPPDGTGRQANSGGRPPGCCEVACAKSSQAGWRVPERRHACRIVLTSPRQRRRRGKHRQGGRRSGGRGATIGAGGPQGRAPNRPGPMRRASRCTAPPGATVGALGPLHRDRTTRDDRSRPGQVLRTPPGQDTPAGALPRLRRRGHPDRRQAGMGPAATSAPFTLRPRAAPLAPSWPHRTARAAQAGPDRPASPYLVSCPRTAPAGKSAVWTLT